MLVKSFITLLLVWILQLVNANADLEEKEPVITDILHLETSLGKIEIGLFGDIVPETTENFVKLAPIYEETKTKFHRVIKDFVIQAGDIDGKGGHSAFGNKGEFDSEFGSGYSGLKDENFILKHDKIGRVSVANAGPNTGGSQFFICLSPQPHLDGVHVVFGQVIQGLETLNLIAKSKTDSHDKPIDDIIIERAYAGKPDFIDFEDGVEYGVEDGVEDDSELPAEDKKPDDNEKNKDKEAEKEPANEGNKNEQDEMKGASSIAFLPLIIMFILVLILMLKNKNRFLHLIRGPRYRRVISVNGDNS